MFILPIRTESETHRPPRANVFVIGINVGMFVLFNGPLAAKQLEVFRERFLTFQSDAPAIYQFLTYQFLHADIGHLLGNMVFLWVFGNSVNGKMGDLPYLLFYLSGGMFAAWGYAVVQPVPFELVGASGAIAAVTTAYLALFPRSHVTTLVWFVFFLQFFELPAMLFIGLKIIVWDNILAPMMARGPDRVAYGAHLAGYLFGFVAAVLLLWFRAVPRDQFDMIAVWRRWLQRREMRAVMAGRGSGPYLGNVARRDALSAAAWEAEHRKIDAITDVRTRIGTALEDGDPQTAADLYIQLRTIDPNQCLSELQQLTLARFLYSTGRFAEAVAAFARFVECYPASPEAPNVRLLLGIIQARDLKDLAAAETSLTAALEGLRDPARRDQAAEWLQTVRAALGRAVPSPYR